MLLQCVQDVSARQDIMCAKLFIVNNIVFVRNKQFLSFWEYMILSWKRHFSSFLNMIYVKQGDMNCVCGRENQYTSSVLTVITGRREIVRK